MRNCPTFEYLRLAILIEDCNLLNLPIRREHRVERFHGHRVGLIVNLQVSHAYSQCMKLWHKLPSNRCPWHMLEYLAVVLCTSPCHANNHYTTVLHCNGLHARNTNMKQPASFAMCCKVWQMTSTGMYTPCTVGHSLPSHVQLVGTASPALPGLGLQQMALLAGRHSYNPCVLQRVRQY